MGRHFRKGRGAQSTGANNVAISRPRWIPPANTGVSGAPGGSNAAPVSVPRRAVGRGAGSNLPEWMKKAQAAKAHTAPPAPGGLPSTTGTAPMITAVASDPSSSGVMAPRSTVLPNGLSFGPTTGNTAQPSAPPPSFNPTPSGPAPPHMDPQIHMNTMNNSSGIPQLQQMPKPPMALSTPGYSTPAAPTIPSMPQAPPFPQQLQTQQPKPQLSQQQQMMQMMQNMNNPSPAGAPMMFQNTQQPPQQQHYQQQQQQQWYQTPQAHFQQQQQRPQMPMMIPQKQPEAAPVPPKDLSAMSPQERWAYQQQNEEAKRKALEDSKLQKQQRGNSGFQQQQYHTQQQQWGGGGYNESGGGYNGGGGYHNGGSYQQPKSTTSYYTKPVVAPVVLRPVEVAMKKAAMLVLLAGEPPSL